MKYYAHSLQNADPNRWQGLADHLKGVAKLAHARAEKFSAGSWGEAAGLLHDVGKYSEAFQARLAGNPSQDDSTAGAQIARHHCGLAGNLIAAAVAGHHTGLANSAKLGERTPLRDRLDASVPDVWQHEMTLPVLVPPKLDVHPTVGSERVGFQLAQPDFIQIGVLR